MLIRWAIDVLDRHEGSPDRELPVQAIRNQAAEIVESRTERIILTDLVPATAFMADAVKLQELLSAKENIRPRTTGRQRHHLASWTRLVHDAWHAAEFCCCTVAI